MRASVCVLWITILQQNNETFSIGISGQILSTNEAAEPLPIQQPAVPLSLHSTISRHKTQKRCTKYSTNVLGIWPAHSEPGRGWTSPQTQNLQHRPMAENYVVNVLLNIAIHCNQSPGQNFCWASTMKATACRVPGAKGCARSEEGGSMERRNERCGAEDTAKERCRRRSGGQGQGNEERRPAKEQGRGEGQNGPGQAPSHLILPSPAAQRPSGLPGAAPWLGTQGLLMGDLVPDTPHTFFPATLDDRLSLGRLLSPPCFGAGCSHYLGRPSLCNSPTCQAPPTLRSRWPPPQASAFSPTDLLMCRAAHKILATVLGKSWPSAIWKGTYLGCFTPFAVALTY